jgi:MFS family permease
MIAVGWAAVSTGLFLAASGIGVLIVARVASGVATGLATGTATAGLVELQPRRDRQAAAVVAAGASMTGLGLGPLVAGAFAEYGAMPLRTVFWAYLGACALALAAVGMIPETVRRRDHRLSARPRLAVPPGMGPVMLGAGLGIFAAFAVLGLFSSLVPTFLHGGLGAHNLVLVGAASFLIFITAAVSQAVSARLPARRSVSTGVPVLLVWLAAPQHRAAVVSTFFAVAYVGVGLPAVLTGLISVAVGSVNASAYVSLHGGQDIGFSTSSGTALALISCREVSSAGVVAFSVQSVSTLARLPGMLHR